MEPPTSKDPKKPPLGEAAERRVLWARAGLVYERLWPRAWPLIGIILVFLGISWFDLWHLMPGYMHGLLLLPFIGLAGIAFWHLMHGFAWPTRREAIARLERDSGLTHQPLQTLGDSLALGTRDQASLALWRAHQTRAAGSARDVRVKPPRPDIPGADPYALRVLAVAFAVLGLLYAGPDWLGRIGTALHPDLSFKGGQQASIDAWITPPAYTQTPPIFLTGAEAGKLSHNITAPKGSVLTVRIAGVDRAPFIRRHVKAQAPKDWRASLPMTPDGSNAYKIDVPLGLDETVDVMAGRHRLQRWDIALKPDAPPAIAFKEAPVANEKDLIGIAFTATDDYGVASAELRVQPVNKNPAGPDQDLALADAAEPLVVPLNLPGDHAKSVNAKQMVDLLAHPWAGLEVTLTLAATDEAGQTSLSTPQKIVLPERDFREPLARAIIEQRRKLAAAPRANREHVQLALDALALAPERFTPDVTVYLGLRSAYHRLTYSMTKESLQSVYDLLWNLALHIEDGDLTLAEQSLRDIQNQLMSALSGNASDNQIQQLMAQLKEALNRYMRALEEQAEKAIARGDIPPEAMSDTDVMTSQDFQDLMQAIEDMAKTGARSQAREMLAQLQDILNNLKIGGQGGQMSESEQAMSQALKGLKDIIDSEKQMLDETYRQSGRGAAPQKTDRSTNGLARDQSKLREKLDKLKSQLGQNMPSDNRSLDNAGEAMGNAQDALSEGDANGAVSPETTAIDELQKGMQGLAQALAQSMGGRLALTGSPGGNRDPLGRRRGSGSIADDNVQVPEEMQLQRARRILEEIQRRASDPNRDAKELDYLERLLKRFN